MTALATPACPPLPPPSSSDSRPSDEISHPTPARESRSLPRTFPSPFVEEGLGARVDSARSRSTPARLRDGSLRRGECGVGSRDYGADGGARSGGARSRDVKNQSGGGASQIDATGDVEDHPGGEGPPVPATAAIDGGSDPRVGGGGSGFHLQGAEGEVASVQGGVRLAIKKKRTMRCWNKVLRCCKGKPWRFMEMGKVREEGKFCDWWLMQIERKKMPIGMPTML